MLFDLGVSSPQLDEPRRGFSYMHDAPLDMRMDESAALDACQVVNGWSYEELRRILYEYGEERFAPQIARAIVRRREDKPVSTTGDLAEIIRSAMPPKALREKQHPAKRSFQAIRIAVNGELDALPPMLQACCPGDGWPSSPFTAWRTASSSRNSGSWPQGAPARRSFPCAYVERSPC